MPKELPLDPESSYDDSMPGAPLPIPNGDVEVADNNDNWYALATKNFVINALTVTKACIVSTTESLSATYNNGTEGVGATLTRFGSVDYPFSCDDHQPAVGDRILVKDQPSRFQNGIYTLTDAGSASNPWILTRSEDYDTPSQITRGGSVSIIYGSMNHTTSWMQIRSVSAIGTSSIEFYQLAKSGIYSVTAQPNQIDVSIVDNVATLSFSEDMILPGTGAVTLPAGSTAQRPSTVRPGMVRFNNGS